MSNETHYKSQGIVTRMTIVDLKVCGGFSSVEYIVSGCAVQHDDGSITVDEVCIVGPKGKHDLGEAVDVEIPKPSSAVARFLA